MIPIVITRPSRSPPDREAVFDELMYDLKAFSWAEPMVSMCDEPRYIASNAVELARTLHPEAPWLLYMEDDVILEPEFGTLPELLREADERFPDAGIVSFFSGDHDVHGVHDVPGWTTHQMSLFGWLQCAAVRNTDYLEGFQAFLDDSPITRNEPDWALKSHLALEYETFVLWCPSLVRHARHVPSVFAQWQQAQWERKN